MVECTVLNCDMDSSENTISLFLVNNINLFLCTFLLIWPKAKDPLANRRMEHYCIAFCCTRQSDVPFFIQSAAVVAQLIWGEWASSLFPEVEVKLESQQITKQSIVAYLG